MAKVIKNTPTKRLHLSNTEATMSENNSISGSVRAGYRRSRIEPVDPSTISAPKAPPPPHNSPAPATAKPAEDGQKEGICKKILRGIFLLLNIFLMTLAILMIIMGVTLCIIFRSSGMSILDVAGGASLGKPCARNIRYLSSFPFLSLYFL